MADSEQAVVAHYLSKKPTGNTEVDAYRKRLLRQPYDADAWFGLLRTVKYANEPSLLYESYEDALKQYPSSGHLLANFAELEISRGNKESAEAVFNNNLFNTHAQYEEQQKNDQLREAYHSAVSIPVIKVEEIWKKYDVFENNLDRATAKQQLSRMSSLYMTARTALRETNKMWDVIKRSQPPHGLPIPAKWT
ncbi:mRNA 3'-end-processing protein rna14, partial [Coemansia erecta]